MFVGSLFDTIPPFSVIHLQGLPFQFDREGATCSSPLLYSHSSSFFHALLRLLFICDTVHSSSLFVLSVCAMFCFFRVWCFGICCRELLLVLWHFEFCMNFLLWFQNEVNFFIVYAWVCMHVNMSLWNLWDNTVCVTIP